MFEINPLDLIPQSIKTAVLDTVIDFLSSQAKKLLGDEIAAKLKKLRSDAGFQKSFQAGLKRGIERFKQEYESQDEDMVQAILSDPMVFEDDKFKKILLEMIKRPGSYLDEEREKIVAAFDHLLPGRKNRQRVDLAISYLLRCIVEEVWHLPELQPIYSLQFQRITAESARQQVELQKAQLQELTVLNSGIKQTLLQLTEAVAQQRLLTDGRTDTDKILHNLPNPDNGQFLGREKELARIIQTLQPYPHSQHSVIIIDGIGGIGKSSLALEVGYQYLRRDSQLANEEQFHAIVWVSAKKSTLTADGIKTRPQVFRTLEDIFTAIAITLQREDILRADSDEQPGLICQALTQKRTLLIIDNLETVDDEKVITFLRELPAPTKAIVTTRFRIDAALPIHLIGMPWEDAQKLIQHACFNKQVHLTHDQEQLLFKRTGGVPIAIVWSIAQVGYGHAIETVLHRLGDAQGPIAQFCFEKLVNDIKGKPAYTILLALGLFVHNATRKALGIITQLSELDRDDALVDLERLSLIDKSGDRFSMLPLTKEYIMAQLTKSPEISAQLTRSRIDYLRNLCRSVPGAYYWRRYEARAYIDEAIEIIDGLHWAYENGTSVDVFQLGAAVLNYYDVSGRWNDYYIEYQRQLLLAQTLQDRVRIGHLMNGWGNTLRQKGEYSTAIKLFEESLEHYRVMSCLDGEAITLQNISAVYRKMGNYDDAESWTQAALAKAKECNDDSLIALITCQYGKLERDRGNLEAAWNHFSAVHEWFDHQVEDSPKDEFLERSISGHLGFIAYKLGRVMVAKDLLEKSLAASIGYGTISSQMTIRYRLALVYEALGDREKARNYVEEALGYFERLGMQPDYQEAVDLLERLKRRI